MPQAVKIECRGVGLKKFYIVIFLDMIVVRLTTLTDALDSWSSGQDINHGRLTTSSVDSGTIDQLTVS